jgi:hypothetical protein
MEFQMEDTPAKRKEAKNRPPSAAVVARSAMLLLAAVLFAE